jgi:hypothetical protein
VPANWRFQGADTGPTPLSDYTPYVQAMLTSNSGKAPDVAYLVATYASVQGLSKGLRQAGFNGVIVNPTTYAPRIVAAANTLEVYTQWATPEPRATAPQEPPSRSAGTVRLRVRAVRALQLPENPGTAAAKSRMGQITVTCCLCRSEARATLGAARRYRRH